MQEIAALARELSLWRVIGAVHRLTPPHRPHNSLYVISDRGEVVTRYDERMLSNTKLSFTYTPGSTSVTFDVDGVRFGCLVGMEVQFPELFLEYEWLDVDRVLVSTVGLLPNPDDLGAFATDTLANAGTYAYWVSFAATAQDSANASSKYQRCEVRPSVLRPQTHTTRTVSSRMDAVRVGEKGLVRRPPCSCGDVFPHPRHRRTVPRQRPERRRITDRPSGSYTSSGAAGPGRCFRSSRASHR